MADWPLTVLAVALGIVAALAVATVLLVQRRRRRAQSNSPHPEPGSGDVIRLASYALASGNADRAAYILERYIDRAGKRDLRPEPWELLLDIYRERRHADHFSQLAKRYARLFHYPRPEFDTWREEHPADGDLEASHPKLLDELARSWRKGEARAFVEGLLDEPGRPGRPRYGSAAIADLLALRFVLTERDRRARQEETAEPDLGEAETQSEVLSALERYFPRIASQLVTYWGSPRADRYLNSLIIDDRGNRAGFSQDIMAEILFLRNILAETRPAGEPGGDVWGGVGPDH